MIRKVVESNLERKFLAAMVMSKSFLASVAPTLDISLLKTRFIQQIAEWCVQYFTTYGQAPGKGLEAIYHAWVENEHPPEDDADAVNDFLETTTAEEPDLFADANLPHLLDEISNYLTLRKINRLNETLAASLLYGKSEEALTAIQTFRTVALGDGQGYDPVRDKQAMIRAFAEPPEALIKFPGIAGEFFGTSLSRDSLIGIQGPEKRGKTFWCLEFVYRALRARKRVAMFEVGDLSETQLTKRMAVRMGGVPMTRHDCKGVKVPQSISLVQKDDVKEAEVKFNLTTFPAPLDYRLARKAQRGFARKYKLPTDKSSVMFSVHPMTSINVAGIDAILQRWHYEQDWTPDVVIIDYADILAPENPREEFRHQVNSTWKALRKLSQDWHACVIAPTQANAASYAAKTQKMANFSEDKRKLAHVTGMLGLNQTEKEKAIGVMRLNWIVLRESEFHANQCLWVAQCLPLAQALVKSTR